jgi:hypothetical protein
MPAFLDASMVVDEPAEAIPPSPIESSGTPFRWAICINSLFMRWWLEISSWAKLRTSGCVARSAASFAIASSFCPLSATLVMNFRSARFSVLIDVSAARVGSVAFCASVVLELLPVAFAELERSGDAEDEEPVADSAEIFPTARQLASRAAVQVPRPRDKGSLGEILLFITPHRSWRGRRNHGADSRISCQVQRRVDA